MDDEGRMFRAWSIRAVERADASAFVDAARYGAVAAAWSGMSRDLLGTPDGWTARAVATAMRARHPAGMTGGQADALAANLRDVVRWRRNFAARADPEADAFVAGRRAVTFDVALRRAQAWIATRTRPVPSSEPTVRQSRSGWEVFVPAQATPWADGVAFRSSDEASCEAFLQVALDHRAFVGEWDALKIPTVTRLTHVEGVTVMAGKAADGMLEVRFHRGEVKVGSGRFQPAKIIPHVVTGGRLLSGGRDLREGFVGLGLGEVMHRLVEEVTGLRVVPHGLNGNNGMLTRASMSFYAKRIVRGDDLGFGEAERERFATVASGRSRCDRTAYDDGHVMRVLGPLVGGTVGGCCMAGESREYLNSALAWVSLPDGRVATTAGIHDWADLLDDVDVRDPSSCVRNLTSEEMELDLDDAERARATLIAAHVAYDLGLSDVVPGPLGLDRSDLGHLAARDAIVADAALRAARAEEVPPPEVTMASAPDEEREPCAPSMGR